MIFWWNDFFLLLLPPLFATDASWALALKAVLKQPLAALFPWKGFVHVGHCQLFPGEHLPLNHDNHLEAQNKGQKQDD